MWNSLTQVERERLVRLLVRCVEYDANAETISVSFLADDDLETEDVECTARR